MAIITLANGLKTLFCVLGCVMTATLTYTISIDGLPFRKELLTPWMAATLVDFFINVVPLATWVTYKESNWIGAMLWVILLVCFGSITTCAYIFVQLLKLSPQESLQDPIYHALLRHSSRDSLEHEGKSSSVVIARIVFSVLGFLMLGTLIYTLLTDGSPFRKELLTPCGLPTKNQVGITTCAYIVLQLFRLSSQDPIYLVLFNSGNRQVSEKCFHV
ncbi:hypothetical protein CUMW_046530 [Citrus unshiu]|nr:hypothetical protein CUMW_046530 [Citrus unshiu]